MTPPSNEKKSWLSGALDAVKNAAESVSEQAQAHSVDSAATAASMGVGGMAGMQMHAVQIPERPADEVVPAGDVAEVVAGLPPAPVVSSVQGNARARGWNADGEVVFGESELAGFALRHAVNNAAMGAMTMLQMATGTDSVSIAKHLTLYSPHGQELVTLECGKIDSQARLPHGEIIAVMKRSTAKKQYLLTGVGQLDGLELRGEPRYRVSQQRSSAQRLRAQRESDGVEQWHPWVDQHGAFVVDAREMVSGAMPMAEIRVDARGDERLAVLAWIAALDYWYMLER